MATWSTKIPLAYIIRLEEGVKCELEDGPLNYPSCVHELISRAPIRTPTSAYIQDYLCDREIVRMKLAGLMQEHDCWSYIRPAQRTTDGCMAFI